MLVSVVIPTLNRDNLIERAVQSVLNQTHKNLEIIVVSDGSTDKTDQIMENMCKQDSRIKYISYHPARGGNVARNIGIDNSNYDYIAFLDDDDEWHTDKIEKQLQKFESDDDIGLVCTGINAVFIVEGTTSVYIPPAPKDSSTEILLKNCIGSTTTVMVKKDILNQCGKFDENLGALQDYDLWTRICQVTKIDVVNEPCVEYYNYPANNQVSQFTDKYIAAIEYINDKYTDLVNNLSDLNKRKRMHYLNMLIAKKGLRNGQPKISRKYSKKAFNFIKSKSAVMCYFSSILPYSFLLRIKHILK